MKQEQSTESRTILTQHRLSDAVAYGLSDGKYVIGGVVKRVAPSFEIAGGGICPSPLEVKIDGIDSYEIMGQVAALGYTTLSDALRALHDFQA